MGSKSEDDSTSFGAFEGASFLKRMQTLSPSIACVRTNAPESNPLTMPTWLYVQLWEPLSFCAEIQPYVGYETLHPKGRTMPCTSLSHRDRTVHVRCLVCRGCSTRVGGVNTHGERFFLPPSCCAGLPGVVLTVSRYIYTY